MPDFNIKNQQKSFTTQNIISLDKQKTEIFTTEIDFLNKIDTEEYFSIIQDLQNEESIIKVSPTYTIMDKKLGISNNFYVKLSKTNDVNILYDMAKNYSIQILGYNVDSCRSR